MPTALYAHAEAAERLIARLGVDLRWQTEFVVAMCTPVIETKGSFSARLYGAFDVFQAVVYRCFQGEELPCFEQHTCEPFSSEHLNLFKPAWTFLHSFQNQVFVINVNQKSFSSL